MSGTATRRVSRVAAALVLATLVPFLVFGGGSARAAESSTAYTVLKRIAGPDGGGWDYATVDPVARRLYLARDNGVLSLDLDAGTLVPSVVSGQGVHGAIPVGTTGRVLVTNGRSNSITVFDVESGKVLGTVAVGAEPDAAVFDPSTGLVAVMNHEGGTVSLVDAGKLVVVRTIKVGGELEFAGATGTGRLWVNVADKAQVAALDLTTGKVVGRYALKGCKDPSGFAYDAARQLIASVCGNGVTKVLRASSGAEVATLKTGLGSDGLILDEARGLLFVPAGRDATLTVVDLAHGKRPVILQRVTTAPGARLGALDAKTGRIYLPTAQFGPPVPPSRWPSVRPGTFAILVVGGSN